LGITFQQVQKYERGANRISASRLWEIGRVLDAPIEWFFEGVGGIESEALGAASKRETLQLAHYFAACPPLVRKRALGLLKATADAIRDARTRAPS
jgi:transcriptional regulator with XRE-family HTH domain